MGGMIGPDGHSPIMQNDFGIHIRNPFSPLDREITEAMIKPQKKFNTIMEEYASVRA